MFKERLLLQFMDILGSFQPLSRHSARLRLIIKYIVSIYAIRKQVMKWKLANFANLSLKLLENFILENIYNYPIKSNDDVQINQVLHICEHQIENLVESMKQSG